MNSNIHITTRRILYVIIKILWISVCCSTSGTNGNGYGKYDADYTNFNDDYLREAPLIIPTDSDVTLEIDQNFTIECESNEPVHWKFFDGFDGQYKVRTIHTADKRRPYGTILELIRINHTYVGEYACVKNDSIEIGGSKSSVEDLKHELKMSTIYIFVNDSENFLVDVLIPMVHGIQFSEVVIPCKPTSKSIEVQLIKDGDESHHINGTYDPTIGYVIRLMSVIDSGVYTCRPKQHQYENEIDFHVQVITSTDYLNKPVIRSPTGRFATQGEELSLFCSVEIQVGVIFQFKWTTPNNNQAFQENRVNQGNATREDHPTSNSLQIGRSAITIRSLDARKDQGLYRCYVEDNSDHKEHDEITMQILKKGEGSIYIEEPSNRYRIEISSTKPEAKWRIKYGGHPIPQLIWYDNQNREILIASNSGSAGQFDKYDVQIGDDFSILKIRSLELSDTGNYTLKAYNGIQEAEKKFQLIVKDKPTVSVNDVYVMAGNTVKLICECAGYPPSKITWLFTPCNIRPVWPTCDVPTRGSIGPIQESGTTVDITLLAQKSELIFTPMQPGVARCFARNTEGNDTDTANVLIGDINEPVTVWLEAENQPIAAGDSMSLHCGALVYNYTAELNWYLDDIPVEISEDLSISEFSTDYSYRKTLVWKHIRSSDSGSYECRANVIRDESTESKSIYIQVHEPYSPIIDLTNLNVNKMDRSLGEPVRLVCKFVGVPIPQVAWYKDGILFKSSDNDTRISLFEESSVLDITFLKVDDEGEYTCEGSNRLGSSLLTTNLKIQMPPINKIWIIVIVILILILLICTIYLCIRVRRGKRLLKEMKAAGLMNFVEGNPDSINPELSLDEQADLLPYDKKYEFPREKLNLGKQLGAGAFGVVVKATAHGILPYEDETTVAVKMVKQTADNEIMRALVTELKIMVHLGQHLNVVNLLGAVTKNIAKREVMVIVEYCRFGNVQNFLIKHRDYFVDQINPETNTIDPTILTKEQRWSNDSGYEYNRNRKDAGLQGGGPPRVHNDKKHNHHSTTGIGEYFPGGMDSSNTESALITTTTSAVEGEDNLVLSNNSVQPAWRSNYKMDYKGPLRYITTTDLVCWSFQVARGMEYLSSRKVLHGDLAARNILLCDDNIVKICDFGLARSMYKNDNYKKKGDGPLPFKWLAIESIGDQLFSTYSDVWSFGIVMWELFSLGKVPYPGMDADQGLYFKIKDGYRMERPENATQELYDIMLNCWNANPETRPLFSALEARLGRLLENGVAEHYIDLNEPYLQSNIDMLQKQETDYLSLMGPPDGMAPSIPHYINKNALPNSNVPDYLLMNPKSGDVIFSPRVDTIKSQFTYPSAPSPPTEKTPSDIVLSSLNNNGVQNENTPKQHSSKKINNKPFEEVPMLLAQSTNHRVSTTSSEEEEVNSNRKWAERQFSDFKPEPAVRTHVTPALTKPSTDHYVNVPTTMPAASIAINMTDTSYQMKDAVSNPGYVAFSGNGGGKINETET